MAKKIKKRSINELISAIFFEIADILEMQNVQWKPQAYRKAAKAISFLKKDVSEIYKKDGVKGLEDISGVGEALARKIVQYIETGKINEYERLKQSEEAKIRSMLSIPGIGPKKIKKLYQELHIRNLEDLKKAIAEHKIAKLAGFGEKSEQDLKESLGITKGKRYPLGKVLLVANRIIRELKTSRTVDKIDVAGSIRRKKATVRDIDILATSKNPKKAMEKFASLKAVARVLAKGPTKSTVILKSGIQADIRVVPKESYGAALLYFTGSKEYNIHMREIAIRKGYKLSEYGLFDRKTNKLVAGASEEEIFKKLGMRYVKPEEREV